MKLTVVVNAWFRLGHFFLSRTHTHHAHTVIMNVSLKCVCMLSGSTRERLSGLPIGHIDLVGVRNCDVYA